MHSRQKGYFSCFMGLFWPWLIIGVFRPDAQAQFADPVNRFPVVVSAEAFPDRPARISAGFNFFFPKDENSYVPVSSELALFLASRPPEVLAGLGWHVRVLKIECQPRELTVAIGASKAKATGGRIEIEVEITPDRSVKMGTQTIEFLFPTLDLAFTQVGVREMAKATLQLTVEVWPSPEAKQEALRLVEDERKRQEEAKAHARREAFARRIEFAGPFLALVGLVGLVAMLNRKWLWPDVKVRIAAGEHRQLHHALFGAQDDEPGTILQTAWAKTWTGRRQRIKVETFVAEVAPFPATTSPEMVNNNWLSLALAAADGAQPHVTTVSTTATAIRSRLDLLISAGASVRPGIYLAALAGRTVRIRVRRQGAV